MTFSSTWGWGEYSCPDCGSQCTAGARRYGGIPKLCQRATLDARRAFSRFEAQADTDAGMRYGVDFSEQTYQFPPLAGWAPNLAG